MPKTRTRKSVAKRFRVTKNGKVLHRSSFARHLRSSKSTRQKRRQAQIKLTVGPVARRIKRMLGLA